MLSQVREVWRPYAACLRKDRIVRTLDPLGADSFFRDRLPALNTAGDPNAILEEFSRYLPGPDALLSFRDFEAMAAIRDIGLVASSLVRQGMTRFDFLEAILLALGAMANEVPVDTVFTYGPRNPRGLRRRSFTATQEEYAFIDAFSDGMRDLTSSVACLEAAQGIPATDSRYAQFVNAATTRFGSMIKAMLEVRQRVSPEFFTNTMRPYFEPKVVGGKTYLAAGGAQMPVILMDIILWGAEEPQRTYIRYWKENVEYHPEPLRRKVGGFLKKGSLVSKLVHEAARARTGEEDAAFRLSVEATIECLVALEKFRYPHLRVAEANMKIRPVGAVGSGGYDTGILKFLIERTSHAASALRTL